MSEVVGEDLGTVPDEVREAMAQHGLQRMYVLPFELTSVLILVALVGGVFLAQREEGQ